MRLTSNRFYLDHNASSPLSSRVQEFLKSEALGDSFFANPSSFHQLGGHSRALFQTLSDQVLEFFGLSGSHEIVFHSGATEGVQGSLKGVGGVVFVSAADHPCATVLGERVLPVLGNGDVPVSEWVRELNSVTGLKVLNVTLSNHESGVVVPFSVMRELKEKTGVILHGDASQWPGKMEKFWELDPVLDLVTFSGHKIGALRGVGATLIRKGLGFVPMLTGGGQQSGRRSGTENLLGAQSLVYALGDLRDADISLVRGIRDSFQKFLIREYPGVKVLGGTAGVRNANTLLVSFPFSDSQILLIALDREGVLASAGAACATGRLKPSSVAKAYGLGEDEARRVVRFSFGAREKEQDLGEIQERIVRAFQRLK